MVWACVEKREALCRKEGDGNESTGEKEERKTSNRKWLDTVRDVIKEKGLSADEVYDRATWRRMSSYIDLHIKVGKDEVEKVSGLVYRPVISGLVYRPVVSGLAYRPLISGLVYRPVKP